MNPIPKPPRTFAHKTPVQTVRPSDLDPVVPPRRKYKRKKQAEEVVGTPHRINIPNDDAVSEQPEDIYSELSWSDDQPAPVKKANFRSVWNHPSRWKELITSRQPTGSNQSVLSQPNKTDLNKIYPMEARSEALFSQCQKPGDVILLTFAGEPGHSSIIAYDENKKGPVYLSTGTSHSYKREGHNSFAIVHDISNYQDMVNDRNTVKLERLNTKAMIAHWQQYSRQPGRFASRNGIVRDLLLVGYDFKERQTPLQHNNPKQYPADNLALAKKIGSSGITVGKNE